MQWGLRHIITIIFLIMLFMTVMKCLMRLVIMTFWATRMTYITILLILPVSPTKAQHMDIVRRLLGHMMHLTALRPGIPSRDVYAASNVLL